MKNLIFRSIYMSFSLMKNNLSLIVPMLFMVVVERAVHTKQDVLFSFTSSPWEAWKLLVFYHWNLILVLLILAASVKAVFVLFSNEDIILAFQGDGLSRYGAIRRSRFKRQYFYYCVFTLGWYVIFFSIGTLLVMLSAAFDDTKIAWLSVGLAFLALCPIFFGGISIWGFLVAIKKHEICLSAPWQSNLKKNFWRLYVFYFVRSFVDTACLVGVPTIITLYCENLLLRYSLMAMSLAVSILFIRSTAIAYKRAVFGVRAPNK